MKLRLVGLAYGLVCHGLFAVAIAAMVGNLYCGMQLGLGPSGTAGLVWNLLLVLQFPILHSALLTPSGRTKLRFFAPSSVGSTLDTTLFATVSSLQTLALFALWSPLPGPTGSAGGPAAVGLTAAYALGWLALLKAMAEAGLGIQTGSTGWTALWRGDRPRYPKTFATTGLHGIVRHPIYAAFAVVLWTGPHWSIDRLVLGIPLTLYCIFGPRFKEARNRARYGKAYDAHLDRTSPRFVPSNVRPRRTP